MCGGDYGGECDLLPGGGWQSLNICYESLLDVNRWLMLFMVLIIGWLYNYDGDLGVGDRDTDEIYSSFSSLVDDGDRVDELEGFNRGLDR